MSQAEETSRPSIAVVIPTRDRPLVIGRAVASILANSYPAFQLLVVDQSRDEATVRVLAPYRSDRRFSHLRTETTGVSIGRNIGLARSCAEIVAFTDDDCVVSPDWLSRIADGFAAHPEAELLYGTVLPASALPEPGGFVPVYLPDRPLVSNGSSSSVVLGMGANMALRRTLLARVGAFDEVMGPGAPLRGGEDFDFALRAVAAGVAVLSDPRPIVVHENGVRRDGAARAHCFRDGYGVGVAAAKTVKCRHWRGLGGLLRFGGGRVIQVAIAILTWRRPFGLTFLLYRLAGALQGFTAGIRWPVERGRRRFRSAAPSASATHAPGQRRL